jgi:hypothetical protein
MNTQHPRRTLLGSLAVIGAFAASVASAPAAVAIDEVPALPWPGSPAVTNAADANVFGGNLSGLAYQPAASGSPAVLWAVRNGPSTLFRLSWDGAKWTPDGGRQLVFPDGSGVPDAEGVTLADGHVYVSIERNDDGPNSKTSRPGVLRYDVSAPGATLTASKEWNLTADLPGLGQNAGLEAITWVPDSVLVAKGFFDEAAGARYDPARYADHGTGLFFVGVEQDGRILAYALNHADGTFTRVASIASGFPKLMDLSFDPETSLLWAVCDDSCDGRTATLDVAASGRFAIKDVFERPAGMPNLNNEGFAIASRDDCVNGLKPVFYADDSNTGGHALRAGAIACTPPAPAPQPTTPPQAVVPSCGCGGAPAWTRLSLSLKLRRPTGRLALTVDHGARANLTITVKAKARTLLKTTRRGVPAGKRTFTLTLSRKARASLRKGQTLTVTVQARHASGTVATKRISAKVR